MRNRLRVWCAALCLLVGMLAAPGGAVAQEPDPDLDARLQGYVDRKGGPTKVEVAKNSTATTWLMFLFFAAIGMAVLFKNAKRTHLD